MWSIRRLLPLFRLELRQLLLGRAWLLLALLLSLLVGLSFRQALGLYEGASRSALGAPDLVQGLNPFDGILVPTFGGLYLAATLLLPFVAIRQVGADRDSGALKLLLRSGFPPLQLVFVKLAVLLLAWTACLGVPLSAALLWQRMGGHVHGPELAGLLLGHGLYGLAVLAVSLLAGSLGRSPATAALLALGATLGSWVLDFNAELGPDWIRALAPLSLTRALRPLERGLLEGGHLLGWLLGVGLLVGLSAVFLHPGRRSSARAGSLAAALLVAFLGWVGIGRLRSSWDLTEDRRHSFPPGVERALRNLPGRLRVDVNLNPDDPRWMDLERQVIAKLKRQVPKLELRLLPTGAGPFGGEAGDRYGEVAYRYEGRSDSSRSTSPEEVLPLLWALTRTPPPPEEAGAPYPGYPLVPVDSWSGPWFMALLPALLAAFWLIQRLRVPFRRRPI